MKSAFRGQLIGKSYSGVLERGRRAGGVPKNFRAIIIKWATAKGISFSSDSDRALICWAAENRRFRDSSPIAESPRLRALCSRETEASSRL